MTNGELAARVKASAKTAQHANILNAKCPRAVRVQHAHDLRLAIAEQTLRHQVNDRNNNVVVNAAEYLRMSVRREDLLHFVVASNGS